MQYQTILLLLNVFILVTIYFLCKHKPKMLKLLIATTLYAYILAVPLPYLLLWIPIKWIIVFYVAAVGLSIIIINIIMVYFEDIKKEKASYENMDGNLQEMDETWIDTSESLMVDTDVMLESDSCTTTMKEQISSVSENNIDLITGDSGADGPQHTGVRELNASDASYLDDDMDFMSVNMINETVEAEGPQDTAAASELHSFDAYQDNHMDSIALEGLNHAVKMEEELQEIDIIRVNIDESEAALSLNYMEVSKTSMEPLSIDQLIDKAFDAKCQDDYISAIELFRIVLSRRPSTEIAQLVGEDIEIMLKKIS